MLQLFDLQRFAEGGDGAAAAGAGSGVTPQAAAGGNSGVTGTVAAPHRSGRRNPLADVQYGVQEGAQQQGKPAQAQSAQQDDAAAWQEAKTRHKAQYDADVRQIVQARLKDTQGLQQAMETLQPMLTAMAKQWGIKEGDHQALVDHYLDDDSLYEEEAIETGMSTSAVKQLHKMRAERDKAQQQVSQFTEQAQMEQHLRGLVQQGEILRQKYPMFDLQAAMQDERFVRMTSPNGGLSVEEAYAALHHDEMQAYAMAQASQNAMRRASQTVQANMARPTEIASRGSAPAAPVRSDPSQLGREDIKEIISRAKAGRKIRFD